MLYTPAEKINEIKNTRKKIMRECHGRACQALRIIAEVGDPDIAEEELREVLAEAENAKDSIVNKEEK